MARLNINPTRMNLSILKTKLETSKRGHKLLKDKQDELMRQFITLIKENKKLRLEVEDKLQDSFKAFLMASAAMSPEMLEEAIALPTTRTLVDIKKKNIMSVNVPEMEFITKKTSEDASRYPYGYAQTTSDLDSAIDNLTEVMEELLTLTRKDEKKSKCTWVQNNSRLRRDYKIYSFKTWWKWKGKYNKTNEGQGHHLKRRDEGRKIRKSKCRTCMRIIKLEKNLWLFYF